MSRNDHEPSLGESPSASSAQRTRERTKRDLGVRGGRRRILPGGGKERRIKKREGSKTRITNLQRAVVAKTGMLPLDFLTAVYRDELYTEYERKVTHEGAVYFVPTPKATKVKVTLDQRIRCAADAAPYVHRKMPQGIEVNDKQEKIITHQQLRQLPKKDLALLFTVFERMDAHQLPASLKGAAIVGAKTYTQDGEEIKP